MTLYSHQAKACFLISFGFCSAEILDSDNNIYTHEDDEFQGLSIESCVGTTESLMQSDEPFDVKKQRSGGKRAWKKNKPKFLKKRLKKKVKKHQRRRGKKFCCKKGIQNHLNGLTCEPSDKTLLKALQSFAFDEDKCSEIFKVCCQDRIEGGKL